MILHEIRIWTEAQKKAQKKSAVSHEKWQKAHVKLHDFERVFF